VHIVEESEATAGEAEINLVNTGVCCFRANTLWPALRRVKKSSRTGEYYLTDVFATLDRRGLLASDEEEAMGVNDRWQLAAAEAVLRRRKNRELAQSGVTLIDPDTIYIDSAVSIEADAVIHPFSFLRGRTSIGARSQIGPFAEINDCVIGRDCAVGRSHLAESVVEDGVDIGPFNRLRAGTVVAKKSRIGTHTEIKNTLVLGKGVNIGAGTVTANFNGVVKRQTVIGDDVFIGTDSTLVAPVSIGDRAYTAAGSVITVDVAADALAIERSEQREVPRWSQRRRKVVPATDRGSRSG
jgi:bifunctional UDP-N-acetylglucosamine pyrophosphorylase/glucosamine-1-phosphate N-acetyltransferase